jgi:site-specific recombinase XerC
MRSERKPARGASRPDRMKRTPYVMPPAVAKHRGAIVDHMVNVCGLDRPTAEKSLPKKGIKLSSRRALTKPELEDWLKLAHKTKDPVTRRALCLLPYSGLRATEVCMLHKAGIRVHPKGSATILLAGKNGKVATVHIPKTGAAILQAAVKASPDPTWVFFNGKGHITPTQLRAACKAVSRKDKRFAHVTPHFLRHTFVTAQIGRCEDVRRVMEQARHNSLKTTISYAHPSVLASYSKR